MNISSLRIGLNQIREWESVKTLLLQFDKYARSCASFHLSSIDFGDIFQAALAMEREDVIEALIPCTFRIPRRMDAPLQLIEENPTPFFFAALRSRNWNKILKIMESMSAESLQRIGLTGIKSLQAAANEDGRLDVLRCLVDKLKFA